MTLRGNAGRAVLAAIIFAAVLYLIIPLDFMLKGQPRSLADIPHEDPATARQVFSGVSYLTAGSDYLDLVLQMNPEEVEAMLRKWPSSHISESLKEATSSFTASGMALIRLLVGIEEDIGKLQEFRGQFRLDEATEQAVQISDNLSQANSELRWIEQAIDTIDTELKASSAPQESNLRQSYENLVDGIDKIRGMLDSYNNLLADLPAWTEKTEKSLESTDISLAIQPSIVFVGDTIRFEGVLTSGKGPLAGREVDILINSTRLATVKTDASGHYQGTSQVPYWDMPEPGMQALYHPQDKDIGVYLASLSAIVNLEVMYYESGLKIALGEKVYPGLETMITGKFDYGQYPPLSERRAEIYFDDALIAEFAAQEAFAREIRIDPEADAGEHIITVSSPAAGRYSPVLTRVAVNVTRAIPVIDLSTPGVMIVPGSVRIKGRLYSEIGPLSEASIKIQLGKSQIELASSGDGEIDTRLKAGMGFGLLGWQDLVTQVSPDEPWHASLSTASTILVVNAANCGAFIIVLLFLGIYLPRRLKIRLGVYPGVQRPAMATVPLGPARTYQESENVLFSIGEGDEASTEPQNIIFYRYRLAVRLLQGITRALLGPQQTLREFARESSAAIGAAAKHLIELTGIIERVLYSQYRPTGRDAEKSKLLYHQIEEETKLRSAPQPLPVQQLQGARFGHEGLPVIAVPTAGLRGEVSVWLFVLLIITVAYYAGMLLFLLPLLLA